MYFVHDLNRFFSSHNSRILFSTSLECQVQATKVARNDSAGRLSLTSQMAISSIVDAKIPSSHTKTIPLLQEPQMQYAWMQKSSYEERLVHIRALGGPLRREMSLHFSSIYYWLYLRDGRKTQVPSHYKRHSNLWICRGKQHSYDAEQLSVNW